MLSFLPPLITEFSCNNAYHHQDRFSSCKTMQNRRKQEVMYFWMLHFSYVQQQNDKKGICFKLNTYTYIWSHLMLLLMFYCRSYSVLPYLYPKTTLFIYKYIFFLILSSMIPRFSYHSVGSNQNEKPRGTNTACSSLLVAMVTSCYVVNEPFC